MHIYPIYLICWNIVFQKIYNTLGVYFVFWVQMAKKPLKSLFFKGIFIWSDLKYQLLQNTFFQILWNFEHMLRRHTHSIRISWITHGMWPKGLNMCFFTQWWIQPKILYISILVLDIKTKLSIIAILLRFQRLN